MQDFIDEEGNKIPEDKVTALPTKRFFMNMLTRDIELEDAIMDLIDNCIDGIHRLNKNQNKPTNELYKGFFGHLTVNGNEFILTDNCGGIPLKIAKEYAFKMGRSEDDHKDDELETIGMYGIGMKRAIFKMGAEAEVLSHTDSDTFKVSVPKKWSQLAGWFFDFSKVDYNDVKDTLKEFGTSVKVAGLYPNISEKFADEEKFVTDLRETLKKHYGFIISQGFTITVNKIPVTAVEINILTSEKNGQSIRPYFYSDTINDVKVDVIIGFYREPASDTEIQEELEGSFAKRTTENAGITVLCNDRIVLYADKSYTTGWGDSPIPQYHTQFINIAGVIHFRAKNSLQLPVTTTKRGLDTSASLFGPVKNRIKEGLKYFTDFTNKWKADSDERRALFQDLKPISALKLGQSKSSLIDAKITKRNDGALYQLPDLPKPPSKGRDKDILAISFKKHKNEIAAVREMFFDDKNVSPNDIGIWCFDQFYKETK